MYGQRKGVELENKKKVCHNARIERITPVTNSCGRGDFLEKKAF